MSPNTSLSSGRGVRFAARTLTSVVAIGLVTVLTSGAKSCGSPDPDAEPICKVANDCEGLPHIECVGAWSCDEGQCNYTCKQDDPDPDPQPTGCTADADCKDGQACEVMCYDCMPGANCPPCHGECVQVPPPDEGCAADSDCAKGQVCEHYPCLMMPCTETDKANGESWCGPCGGQCVDATPDPIGCSSDLDCKEGTHCEKFCAPCLPGNSCPCSTQCVDDVVPPVGCSSDTECNDGEYCVIEVCPKCFVPPDGDPSTCPPCTGTCQPKEAPTCSGDWDCQVGEICELVACTDAACDPNSEKPCPSSCYGYCVAAPPSGCTSDAECKEGSSCIIDTCPACKPAMWCPCTGTCQPNPDPVCSTDADCAAGETCELIACTDVWCDPNMEKPCLPPSCTGTCKPADDIVGCSDDSECKPGYTCAIACPMCFAAPCPCIGTCMENTPPPCEEDSQCPAGQACVKDVCPMAPCTYDPATGETWCPPCYGTCQDVEPGYDCKVDSDCESGYCAIEVCTKIACQEGQPCPVCLGHCAPKPNECVVTGCSGQICAAEEMASTCEWQDEYACYAFANCSIDASGACGWQKTDAYIECINGLNTGCSWSSECASGEQCTNGQCEPKPPTKCVVTGCSGQICAAKPMITTCEYKPQYACYANATCTEQADGACAWTKTEELSKCLSSSNSSPSAIP